MSSNELFIIYHQSSAITVSEDIGKFDPVKLTLQYENSIISSTDCQLVAKSNLYSMTFPFQSIVFIVPITVQMNLLYLLVLLVLNTDILWLLSWCTVRYMYNCTCFLDLHVLSNDSTIKPPAKIMIQGLLK